MSVSLATLPPELFNCVVASIESKHTLCNLAQCSRHFYLSTIRHLYCHVTIREEIREDEQQNGQVQNLASLRSLASLLIRRPDLAGLVRHFTLHVTLAPEKFKYFQDYQYYKGSVSPETFKADQAFKTAVDALRLSRRDEISWLRQLSDTYKCYPDLILALLLPNLPKVEKVALDMGNGYGTPYLEWMIRRAVRRERPFDTQPLLEALTVFVNSYDIQNGMSSELFALLLRLPAIQMIAGGFGNQGHLEDKTLAESASFSSPLTSLHLTSYPLSTADIGHILRVPKALKTFLYLIWPAADISFALIRQVLGPQEKFLESLGFDYDDNLSWLYSREEYKELRPMASFVSFNALKFFKTVASFLESTENGTERQRLINLFPPNLETLHLTRMEKVSESLLEAIEHLVAQKSPDQIPLLKTLILEETNIGDQSMNVLWKDKQATAIWRLSRVAAAQGVSIDVIMKDTPRSWLDSFAMA